MQQTEILPQQSLQTIANWGITFSAKPDEEKEFIQLYGKPLYRGAIAIAQWWRSLSIGQVQAINQIDFPYWTLDAARKLSQVPRIRLNCCLDALQKVQKSVGKLSRILNKFIAPKKLSFGRTITSDDWDLIARSFDLDGDCIDEIRQLALRTNGASAQSVTTDDVIEVLKQQGYPVEQILPKPRIKRYSRTEVEQVIRIKVQEAVQTKEQELLTLLERSRYLETENERLMTRLRSPSQCPTTVEITPITEEELEQPDVFERCLDLWKVFENCDSSNETPCDRSIETINRHSIESEPVTSKFKIGDRVLVIDNTDNNYYGLVGGIIDQELDSLSETLRDCDIWWVQFKDGDCQRFGTSAIEILPQESKRTSIQTQKQVIQKLKEIEQVPMAG